MNLEFEPDKVRQDGGAASLRLDGWSPLAWCRTNDWKSIGKAESSVVAHVRLKMHWRRFAEYGGEHLRHDIRTWTSISLRLLDIALSQAHLSTPIAPIAHLWAS